MANPKLYITPKAIATIKAYARNCEDEISGWASVNNKGIIDRVFPLLDQQVSGADTEMDEEALEEFIRSGQSKTANVWWHTHAKMNTFWSATDDHNISQLLNFFPYLVSIETNHEAEAFIARVDYRIPVRFRQDCDLTILYNLPEVNEEAIQKEIKEKVKTRTYRVHGPIEHIPSGIPLHDRVARQLNESDFFGFSEEALATRNNGKIGPHYRYGRIIHVPSTVEPKENPAVKDKKDDDVVEGSSF